MVRMKRTGANELTACGEVNGITLTATVIHLLYKSASAVVQGTDGCFSRSRVGQISLFCQPSDVRDRITSL
jgi:hypothetical protein